MTIRARFSRWLMVLLCTGAIAGLSGCRHKQMVPLLLAAPQLEAPTMPPLQTLSPPMTADLPDKVALGPQAVVTEAKPKRTPKKIVSKAPAEDTADTASVAPVPAAAAIGQLSAGGVSNSETQQAAVDLIAGSEKRLDTLPKGVEGQQLAQIRKVRYFLRQAQQALNTGDAEGARTLATKAKLLLDDLEKAG